MNSCMYVEPNKSKNQYTINLAIGNLASLKTKHKPNRNKRQQTELNCSFSLQMYGSLGILYKLDLNVQI